MSATVFFTTTILVLGALIAVFAIMGVTAVLRARATGAGADSLRAIQATLASIDGRLAAVERLLKEV